MPEFFLELFSEEIPARMQARAADDLARLVGEAIAPLAPANARSFYGPRRIALAVDVAAAVAESRSSERGPRRNAPEQALAGFLRKHGAAREQLRAEGDFWVLDKETPGVAAATLIASVMPDLLRRFPWPKSMRWGGTSAFTWVRPLRRIVCLLDGELVKFDLRDGDDDGHGLAASKLTEGHRFLSPGAFAVTSCAEWQEKLREHHVVVDASTRKKLIADGLRDLAATRGLAVVDDPGLLDEVTGLVEWPVPLLGKIDAAYMDLPAEVLQVSMRVNQRYFSLRDALGRPAPHFAFVANIAAADGGRTIVAGNERVLRARFADARHFWDLDRTRLLFSRVPALDGVTFHARLGSQGERVRRLVRLAAAIAPFTHADRVQAERAAVLAKADLTTAMVGEFPELQGVMGRYYAIHDGEDACVADAIRDHYAPRGPTDEVPGNSVGVTVALADKLDQLAGFFAIGEKPTGSGDPYAVRRAALGIIRIIREKRLRILLRPILNEAVTAARVEQEKVFTQPYLDQKVAEITALPGRMTHEAATRMQEDRHILWVKELLRLGNQGASDVAEDILIFLAERLRVQLRAEGARHDVLAAVLGAGMDDDFFRLLARTDAVAAMLGTDNGKNLLVGYKRAANILRIEERKDGPHDGAVDTALLEDSEERTLATLLDRVAPAVATAVGNEHFTEAVAKLASLRPTLDAFFDRVTVNDARPEMRRNRLALLSRVRLVMNGVADFSRIEG
jgi:glycyl-tRNA synthetase beta chain